MKQIALIADFNPDSETHAATTAALTHASEASDLAFDGTWIGTDEISEDIFQNFDGMWVGTGSPYRNMEKVLWAIEQARIRDFPILATCGGFQHLILEFARNELQFLGATHEEYDAHAEELFITRLQCSLRGREMQLTLKTGSKAALLYGATKVSEKYYCNFGVNPKYLDVIRNSSMAIVGSDEEGELRVIELPEHRFYLGTLFVPQAQSWPNKAHPLILGFLRAVA